MKLKFIDNSLPDEYIKSLPSSLDEMISRLSMMMATVEQEDFWKSGFFPIILVKKPGILKAKDTIMRLLKPIILH